MTWATSPASATCNRCHKALSGDRCWRGELTTAVWCEPCAQEMGLDGRGVEDFTLPAGLDKRKLAEAAPEFTAAMRRLRDAALRKGSRDVSARILGERE